MGGGRGGQTAFPGSRDGGSEKREGGKGRIMPDKLLIVGFKLFSPFPRILPPLATKTSSGDNYDLDFQRICNPTRLSRDPSI